MLATSQFQKSSFFDIDSDESIGFSFIFFCVGSTAISAEIPFYNQNGLSSSHTNPMVPLSCICVWGV
jgi:hypothetical protein